jgi:hypothetical protein
MWKNVGRYHAQPPLSAVTGYRIADPSSGGEPDAYLGAAARLARPPSGLQDKAGPGGATTGRGDAQKIGP